jgi:hypothetical protein
MGGPIEPVAITAATLLATKALEGLGGRVGESAWAGMGRLLALVQRKVTGHGHAEIALDQVEKHPEDADRIQALGQVLAGFGARDAVFQRELATLVADARRNPTIGPLATQVYGQAQVGQVLTIGQVRDIYIQPQLPSEGSARMSRPPWNLGGGPG